MTRNGSPPRSPIRRENSLDLPPRLTLDKKINDSPFLHLYRMKNNIHEPDRERAASIQANLTYDSKNMYDNPFFNKLKTLEREISLSARQMVNLGQAAQEN